MDFQHNNLHVMSYSTPMDQTLHFHELKDHLYTLPNQPDAIPYRTSYYKPNWGFCLSHHQWLAMDPNAEYQVCIDSTLEPGFLTYGESVQLGQGGKEYLISTYCCHPSLANDNLSGVVLTALLLSILQKSNTFHTYRFLFIPETIGSIAYLSQHEQAAQNIQAGFVVTTVGGPGWLGYKQTYLGNHEIDRMIEAYFHEQDLDYHTYPFDAKGSDERQYSSPRFRIPTVTLCKDKYYEYDYYHTSLDNLNFVKADHILQSLKAYLAVILKLEMNRTFVSNNPACEPMFSKHDLYPSTGGSIFQPAFLGLEKHEQTHYGENTRGKKHQGIFLDAMLWLLFYSDGSLSLFQISEKTRIPIEYLYPVAMRLTEKNLLTLMDATP